MKIKTKAWQRHLFSSLSELKDDNILCDVSISSGSNVFTCHSCILAASSPFFKQLFRQQNRGSNGVHEVKLSSSMSHVLQYVLDFIYKGEVDVPKSKLAKVHKAAVHIQLMTLDVLCESLRQQVSSDSSEEESPEPAHKRAKYSSKSLASNDYTPKTVCQTVTNETSHEQTTLPQKTKTSRSSSMEMDIKQEPDIANMVTEFVELKEEEKQAFVSEMRGDFGGVSPHTSHYGPGPGQNEYNVVQPVTPGKLKLI